MQTEYPVYGFRLQFLDERAEMLRYYLLRFHTERNEIEIFDLKTRRPFLKKTETHNIQLRDLFLGNKVLINARQYEIIEYVDEVTREKFEVVFQHTFVVIKQVAVLGDFLARTASQGLIIKDLRYGSVRGEASELLPPPLRNGNITVMEIVGPQSHQKISELAKSLGSQCYVPSTIEECAEPIERIFRKNAVKLAANFVDTTCAVILPHSVKSGSAGNIIRDIIAAGLTVTGAQMPTLSLDMASEFYEVYRGVADNYNGMVSELSSGPCIVLELLSADSVYDLRKLCGPRDVDVAKIIAPQSLRAKYGVSNDKNAIHCTDLDTDGPIEVEYFFSLIIE